MNLRSFLKSFALLPFAGCVNGFVGNSPEERKHRKQLDNPDAFKVGDRVLVLTPLPKGARCIGHIESQHSDGEKWLVRFDQDPYPLFGYFKSYQMIGIHPAGCSCRSCRVLEAHDSMI